MTSVGSYEAKTHLPELLEHVEHGEKILITRRGTPVALLTQPPPKVARDGHQVVEDMLAYRNRQKRTTGTLSIRQMIEHGGRPFCHRSPFRSMNPAAAGSSTK